MHKRNLLYTFGSKRCIDFCDKQNKTKYLREIVYPIGLSERELKTYVRRSLSREIDKLKLYQPEYCLIFLKKRDKSKIIDGFIDKYWVTGEIMICDYFVNSEKKYLEVAIDIDLDKQEVYSKIKDILYCEFKSEDIKFYESESECWIKRY